MGELGLAWGGGVGVGVGGSVSRSIILKFGQVFTLGGAKLNIRSVRSIIVY